MEMKDLYPFYQQLVRIADALESISDALDRIESGQTSSFPRWRIRGPDSAAHKKRAAEAARVGVFW